MKEYLPYIIAPLTGVVTWFATSRKRDNDAIADLQRNINLLAERNTELQTELLKMQGLYNELNKKYGELSVKQEGLIRENQKLVKQIQALAR